MEIPRQVVEIDTRVSCGSPRRRPSGQGVDRRQVSCWSPTRRPPLHSQVVDGCRFPVSRQIGDPPRLSQLGLLHLKVCAHAGSVATFSRFIPSVKRRYDYGVLIFILTFSMVSVSGYRIDKLMELALQRLSTVGIGGSICIIISLLIYPIWAGDDIHNLVIANLEKLATSLEGSILQFFNGPQDHAAAACNASLLEGYKSVLNSKTTEESLANFARWEPAHGPFNFKYPWKQYLKIGTMSRPCAYCIEALNGCIGSHTDQAPHLVRQRLQSVCINLGACISEVLRELATTIKTMRKSSNTSLLVEEMNYGVGQLQNALRSLPETLHESGVTVMEALPVVAAAALLIEVAARIEDIISAVDELAYLARFKDEKQSRRHEADEHHIEMKTQEQAILVDE